uniref:Uncharacterized protein n=1 Tax=viral metagenome TaxID=1070528 RepID=A0A6M3IJN4_9ZZZZ
MKPAETELQSLREDMKILKRNERYSFRWLIVVSFVVGFLLWFVLLARAEDQGFYFETYWEHCKRVPEDCRYIIHGEPTIDWQKPATGNWYFTVDGIAFMFGDKKIELGLRSDGVVVWRDVQPKSPTFELDHKGTPDDFKGELKIEFSETLNEVLRVYDPAKVKDMKGDVRMVLTTPDGREFTFYWQDGMEAFEIRFEEVKPKNSTP